ncbi:hypothetical protein WJX77_002902 [Trebouxia sp. C0004]
MVALPQAQPAQQAEPNNARGLAGVVLPDVHSMEEVGQLVMKMSKAGQQGDIFKLFAEHVTELVPGLTHINVMLLPSAKQSSDTAALKSSGATKQGPGKPKLTVKAEAPGRLEWQQHMGGSKPNKPDGAKKATLAMEPELLTWPYADLQIGSDMPVLDWRTCKDVLITKKKGVEVKQAPACYPASCTAACYIARSHADGITTPNYLQDGPHFADWGEMQEQGAVSIASAPIHMSNEVVAVLTLASSESAAFEETKAKLVWILAFVLAPYTHILSQTTHKTEGKLFIEAVMPRLLEQGLPHSSSPGDALSGHQQSLQERLHDESLCPQCQLAHDPQGNPGKAGVSGRRINQGGWSATPTELQANGTAASMRQAPGATPRQGATISPTLPFQTDTQPTAQDSDLDWGDFFFNLVSMCIVYAHFSEAAVAGESNAAVIFSMGIAVVDIVLLALRWLWYDQFVSYGGLVSSMFSLYRMIVLPIANTWMSWSLLHKLQWDPTPPLLGGLGLIMTLFLFVGLKVRFFLHAPLQLATVLLAAASAHHICTAVQANTTGAACLSLISALQMLLGLLVPSFLTFMLDFRVSSSYLPHVQAKYRLIPQC